MADVYVTHWLPSGTKYTLTAGSNCYIGFVDDTTVLKYPHRKGDARLIRPEADLFQRLPSHERLIGFKGLHSDGILLERAANGSLESYLQKHPRLELPCRISFCRQAAEGVAFFHSNLYRHCDIGVHNMVLDDELNLKYCDLQGRLTSTDGTTIIKENVSEGPKARMPAAGPDEASERTDIFALGSAMYHIVHGTDPFPNLDPIQDEDAIQERFTRGQFPNMQPGIGKIISKCWRGQFKSATDILRDIDHLHQRSCMSLGGSVVRTCLTIMQCGRSALTCRMSLYRGCLNAKRDSGNDDRWQSKMISRWARLLAARCIYLSIKMSSELEAFRGHPPRRGARQQNPKQTLWILASIDKQGGRGTRSCKTESAIIIRPRAANMRREKMTLFSITMSFDQFLI
ncbi:hypothetical protein FH972_024077 [Carpinus fangiana]|uniref:Protein kinase domain-containing protein n=1 Tax=Carpinus fangiana TaxID=176857 RepID=A0A5N6KWZ7_9ROSI|nr:hypothetical protein FH972_024077 [Carpinus fangiana]